MDGQKNSECWYADTCQEDCDRCVTFIQLDWQMKNSGLPPAKQRPIQLFVTPHNECDREKYIRLAEIRKNIVEYVGNGNNLYICGTNTGNGKTSWAIKMLHTYFHNRCEGNYENLLGLYVSTVDLLLKLKDFNNPLPAKYKQQLETVDLVIWDDIAVTGISQYDFTQLYSIINNRIFAGKSNIFTSNVIDFDKLSQVLGSRLASRIYNDSEKIELKGVDMRNGSTSNSLQMS